jgi:hypothetical protein
MRKCNGGVVYDAMARDWMRNSALGIPALLEDGIRLLTYAGEEDLICNWLGKSIWYNNLINLVFISDCILDVLAFFKEIQGGLMHWHGLGRRKPSEKLPQFHSLLKAKKQDS